MERIWIFMLSAVLASAGLPCAAQVYNDSLANRLPLIPEQPHYSTTVGATVEWNCLNQRLTQSCIKYHNDQWFSLEVSENGPYFLNLSDQECRDIWGVQVVILTGQPCVPSSYQLITCHSDGNTDDVFIRLPELTPGQEYLVNVDGYLHDLCSFTIELSRTPKGLPLETDREATSGITPEGRVVNLTWRLSGDPGLNHFEIYRSAGNGQPFRQLAILPHQRNAFGEGRMEYSFTDTLRQAVAEYKVVGQTPGDRLLLLHETIKIDSDLIRRAPENNLILHLDYPEGVELGVLVYQGDSLLFSDEFVFRRQTHADRRYFIGDLLEAGIRRYRVLIIRKDTWKKEELLIDR